MRRFRLRATHRQPSAVLSSDVDKQWKPRKTQSGRRHHRGATLGNKNNLHNNYQDFQAFLDSGGRIGLQHDPLLYGAVCAGSVLGHGRAGVDAGGCSTRPGRRGQSIRRLALTLTGANSMPIPNSARPGSAGASRHLAGGATHRKISTPPAGAHRAEIVPTSILTLNWADEVSAAHNLDAQLKQIVAKSNEGFVFAIDLQVQIHVPDTNAPPRDFHGRDNDESGERSIAGRGGKSLPRQVAEHARHSLYRNAPASAGRSVQAHQGTARSIPRRDAWSLYSWTSYCRKACGRDP